jgi:hypothetical protein
MVLRLLLRASFACFLLILLLILAPPLRADSITIGQLTYLGPSEPPPGMSHVELYLNTVGITFDPYFPGLPYPLTFNGVLAVDYGGTGWETVYTPGIFTTIPANESLLPQTAIICPCTGIRLTLTLEPYLPTTFLLANGKAFTMNPVVTVTLLPPSGKTFLQEDQSAQIVMTSAVPEPTTMVLMGSGLLAVWGGARRKRLR